MYDNHSISQYIHLISMISDFFQSTEQIIEYKHQVRTDTLDRSKLNLVKQKIESLLVVQLIDNYLELDQF